MKRYETEPVPISKVNRAARIIVSSVCCLYGVLLLRNAVRESAGADRFGWLIWGIIVLCAGSFFLWLSITRKHDTRLTKVAQIKRTAADRKRDEVFTAWVLGVIAVLTVVYFVGPISDSLQGRIKAYPVSCSKWSSDSCVVEHAEATTSYIVHVDQQIVVALPEDASVPSQLFNCIVADRRNWTCNIDPARDSTHAVMRDGDFSYDPYYPSRENMRYTSRYRWWLAHLEGK